MSCYQAPRKKRKDIYENSPLKTLPFATPCRAIFATAIMITLFLVFRWRKRPPEIYPTLGRRHGGDRY